MFVRDCVLSSPAEHLGNLSKVELVSWISRKQFLIERLTWNLIKRRARVRVLRTSSVLLLKGVARILLVILLSCVAHIGGPWGAPLYNINGDVRSDRVFLS